MVQYLAENSGRVTRGEILAKLRERMIAYAASRIAGDIAEDLAQEVLVVLEEKYPLVDRAEELLPLSLQILRYKLIAARRKAHRRGEDTAVPLEEADIADPVEDPETIAQRAELLGRLRPALRRMEPRCREIFRLKLEGRSFPEIQALLGARSVNTVYTWDARCRQKLLEMLGGRWEGSRA